jgi:ubiquinone/menaquinone biosynthesis C-methylase UbiE
MRLSRSTKNWDVHVEHAEQIARGAGFRALRDRIVELAAAPPGAVVVDVGSGTGLLTLALADGAAKVWAIDSSVAMGEYLRVKAASAGHVNVEAVHASAASLPLIDGVADVVVSNYCFHELRAPQKRQALAEAFRVLRPGGRLVVGDMMFSLSGSEARDRRLIAEKALAIARRGPPGLWRLAKNAARLLLGRWEHPADARWWRSALIEAGFAEVSVETLAHEGGIASGARPAAAIDLPAGSRRQPRSQPQPLPQASRSAASGSG